MYEVSLRNIIKLINFRILLFLFLIVLLFLFHFTFFRGIFDFIKMDGKTEAYNIEIKTDSDGSYYPEHHYELNGIKYVCESNNVSLNFINSLMMDKTVYYYLNNPNYCTTKFSSFGGAGFSHFIFMLFLSFLFLYKSFYNILWEFKRIFMVNSLKKNGVLIKNLSYRMRNTDVSIKNRYIKRPVVVCKLPNGIYAKLYGNARYDEKFKDEDGFVDLLIDPNNYNNYFIDFEINRIGGNLDSDFYSNADDEIDKKNIVSLDSDKILKYKNEKFFNLIFCSCSLIFINIGFSIKNQLLISVCFCFLGAVFFIIFYNELRKVNNKIRKMKSNKMIKL